MANQNSNDSPMISEANEFISISGLPYPLVSNSHHYCPIVSPGNQEIQFCNSFMQHSEYDCSTPYMGHGDPMPQDLFAEPMWTVAPHNNFVSALDWQQILMDVHSLVAPYSDDSVSSPTTSSITTSLDDSMNSPTASSITTSLDDEADNNQEENNHQEGILHYEVHSGINDVTKCSCGATFRTALRKNRLSNFSRHVGTQNEPRYYPCYMCDSGYNRDDNLKAHMRSKHRVETSKDFLASVAVSLRSSKFPFR
jgi:hypothetical protein